MKGGSMRQQGPERVSGTGWDMGQAAQELPGKGMAHVSGRKGVGKGSAESDGVMTSRG